MKRTYDERFLRVKAGSVLAAMIKLQEEHGSLSPRTTGGILEFYTYSHNEAAALRRLLSKEGYISRERKHRHDYGRDVVTAAGMEFANGCECTIEPEELDRIQAEGAKPVQIKPIRGGRRTRSSTNKLGRKSDHYEESPINEDDLDYEL